MTERMTDMGSILGTIREVEESLDRRGARAEGVSLFTPRWPWARVLDASASTPSGARACAEGSSRPRRQRSL